MTASPRRKLTAFAAGLTLLVGALGGLVAAMVFSADLSASLLEVRIAWTVTALLLVVVALLYVAIPIGVAVMLARENGHPLVYGAAALTTVLFPIAVPVALLWTVEAGPEVGSALSRFVATVVGAIVLLVVAGAAFRRATPAGDSGWTLALNAAVTTVFLLGFLGVQVVAPGVADRHTTDVQPDVDLVFDERTTDDGRSMFGGTASPTSRAPTRPRRGPGRVRRRGRRPGAAGRPSSRATR